MDGTKGNLKCKGINLKTLIWVYFSSPQICHYILVCLLDLTVGFGVKTNAKLTPDCGRTDGAEQVTKKMLIWKMKIFFSVLKPMIRSTFVLTARYFLISGMVQRKFKKGRRWNFVNRSKPFTLRKLVRILHYNFILYSSQLIP